MNTWMKRIALIAPALVLLWAIALSLKPSERVSDRPTSVDQRVLTEGGGEVLEFNQMPEGDL